MLSVITFQLVNSVPVGGVSTILPQPINPVYIKRVKQPTPMTDTITDLKALAQDLRNERREFQMKADYAQQCLNEVQRKLALLKLQSQTDTPMADMYGG